MSPLWKWILIYFGTTHLLWDLQCPVEMWDKTIRKWEWMRGKKRRTEIKNSQMSPDVEHMWGTHVRRHVIEWGRHNRPSHPLRLCCIWALLRIEGTNMSSSSLLLHNFEDNIQCTAICQWMADQMDCCEKKMDDGDGGWFTKTVWQCVDIVGKIDTAWEFLQK